MRANASQRRSAIKRMDRIAELFRRGGNPNATHVKGTLDRIGAMMADTAARRPADTCGPGTPSAAVGSRKASPDNSGRVRRAYPDFSHLHRSLGRGEPIPRAPGLLEQIKRLSQLLAQRPLSQQEEEAVQGEEGDDRPDDKLGGTAA